jgi:hypothetical protein
LSRTRRDGVPFSSGPVPRERRQGPASEALSSFAAVSSARARRSALR